MKKSFIILLVLSMVLGACAPQENQESVVSKSVANEEGITKDSEVAELSEVEKVQKSLDAKRGEGKTIGVVAFFQANDWNQNALKAIKDEVEQYGYEVNIIDGNGDAAAMNGAIDTFIASGVDGIIIAGGDGTALRSGAEKIVAANIPYTCIDMFQEGAVTSVMADNWGGGTQLGLYVVNKIQGKGKVLILDTPSWVTLLARADSADVVFNPLRSDDPKTGIVSERYDIDAGNAVTDSQTKVAAALAADTDHDIKAIVTSWNLPAMGAYAAIKSAGRTDDIVIASGDTGKDVLQAMRESEAGDWVFMGQNSYVLGKRAAQGLDLAIHGEANKVPFSQFGPTYFVSNGNPITDGSKIKLQTPEQHWEEVFKTPFGSME